MGLSTVWIMAASILSAFNILKPLDGDDSMVEYDFSLTLYACIDFSPIKTMSFAEFCIFYTESQSRSSADSNRVMKESKH